MDQGRHMKLQHVNQQDYDTYWKWVNPTMSKIEQGPIITVLYVER
jgi:hypothetical protein